MLLFWSFSSWKDNFFRRAIAAWRSESNSHWSKPRHGCRPSSPTWPPAVAERKGQRSTQINIRINSLDRWKSTYIVSIRVGRKWQSVRSCWRSIGPLRTNRTQRLHLMQVTDPSLRPRCPHQLQAHFQTPISFKGAGTISRTISN